MNVAIKKLVNVGRYFDHKHFGERERGREILFRERNMKIHGHRR